MKKRDGEKFKEKREISTAGTVDDHHQRDGENLSSIYTFKLNLLVLQKGWRKCIINNIHFQVNLLVSHKEIENFLQQALLMMTVCEMDTFFVILMFFMFNSLLFIINKLINN